jgi:hypothetical protein
MSHSVFVGSVLVTFEPAFLLLVCVIVGLVQAFACAFLSSWVAGAKGYSERGWALAGCLFGVLGLLAVVGMPDRRGSGGQVTD